MNEAIRAVLLDLDGTLADTAPDIAAALNRLLLELHLPILPYDVIRPVVSRGGAALIDLAFPGTTDASEKETLRQRFLALYAQALHVDGKLFAGMAETLQQLESNGYPWGVVTNKPAWLTQPLIAALELEHRSGCLVCGDQVSKPKPAPDAVLLACELLQCPPQQAVFVGDARRDIEAGKAAGTRTLAAAWGYIDAEDRPATWGADAVIEHPDAILNWLHAGNR